MDPVNINFSIPKKENASLLPNSEGSCKSRIHLFEYKGVSGEDKYAIAAKIVTMSSFCFASDIPSLNFIEKRFFVLISKKNADGSLTWYKVNKNSLKKRLGINSEELKSHSGNLIALIQEKLESKISLDRFSSLTPLLQDKERLNKLPRAPEGRTAHNIYMPEENDLPVVIRVLDKPDSDYRKNMLQRFGKAREAYELVHSKGFDLLSIPRPWIHGDFMIERRLPVVRGGARASMAFYSQHHEEFRPAIKQFVSFLCQSKLSDLIGESNSFLETLFPDIPRYDNLLVFTEQEEGKPTFKIGLIDTESFELLEEKPSREHIISALSTAIAFFPYNYDEIIKAGQEMELNLSSEEVNTLKMKLEKSIDYFEKINISHLKHLEKNRIDINNPSKLVPISDSLKERLKNQLSKKLLDLHKEGTNEDKRYLGGSKAKNCLGQHPVELIAYFEKELFPGYLSFIQTHIGKSLSHFDHNHPENTLEISANRDVVLEYTQYQSPSAEAHKKSEWYGDARKLDSNGQVKRILIHQLCQMLAQEGIVSFCGTPKDLSDDRILLMF